MRTGQPFHPDGADQGVISRNVTPLSDFNKSENVHSPGSPAKNRIKLGGQIAQKKDTPVNEFSETL